MESHIFRKDGVGHCCFCAECIANQGEKHGTYTGVPRTMLIIRLCRIVVREDRLEDLGFLLRGLQQRIFHVGGDQLREALDANGTIQHMENGFVVWEQSFRHILEVPIFMVDEDKDFNDEYLKVGVTFVFPAQQNVKEVIAWFQHQVKQKEATLIPDAAMSLRRSLSPKTGAAQPHMWWIPTDAAQSFGF